MSYREKVVLGASYRGGSLVFVGEGGGAGETAGATTSDATDRSSAEYGIHNKVMVYPSGCRLVLSELTAGQMSAMQVDLTRRIRVVAISPKTVSPSTSSSGEDRSGSGNATNMMKSKTRLMAVFDESGRLAMMNYTRRVTLHKMSMKDKVSAASFQYYHVHQRINGNVSSNGNGNSRHSDKVVLLLLAVAVGRLLQIWDCSDLLFGRPSMAPMRLIRTFGHASATISSIAFRDDGRWIAAAAKGSMSIRVYAVLIDDNNSSNSKDDSTAGDTQLMLKNFKPPMLSGHRENIVGVFWYGADRLISAAADGAVFVWKFTHINSEGAYNNADSDDDHDDNNHDDDESRRKKKKKRRRRQEEERRKLAAASSDIGVGMIKANGNGYKPSFFYGYWSLEKKFYLSMPAKLTSIDFHESTSILLSGFSHGVFTLHSLPDFENIHRLSISSSAVTAATFNEKGNWIAMGCARLGQMLIWDWRNESYVHRQQGHDFEVSSIDFTPDGGTLVSGGEDGKVKLWGVSSGFNYATFVEHTAPVTAVVASRSGSFVLSASKDGTVRAFDLIRYRQFRIFTTPTPAQLVSLALDPSGELVVSGSGDSFEVFVWSMRTGKLLDVVSGHEGPIGCLCFVPSGAPVLATGSWDHTVKIWDFSAKDTSAIDTFIHTTDVLSIAFSPSGKLLAVSTLDGSISFWDMDEARQVGTIEGRRDIAGGRYAAGDLRSAANVAAGHCFVSIAFSADGSMLFAAGKSKYVCMYDVEDKVLLQRFLLTQNASLDGVLDMRDSRRMTQAGIPLDEIDHEDEDDDFARGSKGGFAGSAAGASLLPGTSKKSTVINCRCISIAHGDKCWAAATPEGVVMYTHDSGLMFDPLDLDEDVTPAGVIAAIKSKQFGKALLMALRLGETALIEKCVLVMPPEKLTSIASEIPSRRLGRLLSVLASLLEKSPHVEFIMRWIQAVLVSHGLEISNSANTHINSKIGSTNEGLNGSFTLRPILRRLAKCVANLESKLTPSIQTCAYTLKYLASHPTASAAQN